MKYILTLVLLLCALPAAAQPIRLHNNPNRDFYQSVAEWPTDESQCWWAPGNNNAPGPMFPETDPLLPIFDMTISHTHLSCALPREGELTGPIPVTCVIKAHHLDGTITGISSPTQQIRDVLYQLTGSSEQPPMVGDPLAAVQEWTVYFIFDPTLPRLNVFPPGYPTLHGWQSLDLQVVTHYANGDAVTLDAIRPLYALVDPTQPESKPSDEGKGYAISTRCSPNTKRRPDLNGPGNFGNQMGTVVAEYTSPLPVAPIQTAWPLAIFPYSYASLEGPFASFRFPDGTFEQRHDANIHAGIAGITTHTTQLQGNAQFLSIPGVLDPALMGTGKHKVFNIWFQPDGQGNNATAVLVHEVEVGPGIPVPTLCTDPLATNVGGALLCTYPTPVTTCQDHTATNFGGPLPCTFPAHVPVVTWVPTPLFLEQQLIDGVPQNAFRFCLNNRCWTFPATPIP